MRSRFLKLSALAACLQGVLFAHGQSGTSFYVPRSSVSHMTKGQKAFHSDYLIFRGVWGSHSRFAPLVDMFEPTIDHGPLQSSVSGYHPADILAAYNIPSGGGSQAIAVIDAFHLPTNLNDFNVFAREFGLPQETSTNATAPTNKVFQVVYAQGSQPTTDTSWNGEIALDMEWAHAIAPKAKIYLVECASDGVNDLLAGAEYAAKNLPGVRVVSMSFGISEASSETQFDSIFTEPNVTFLAAAGDTPNVPTYPAVSPNVISVGGTSLALSGGVVESETYWFADKSDGASSGPSTVEPRPAYQNSLVSIVGAHKGNPDLAADANPDTGCAVYVSSPVAGPGTQTLSGWLVFGGTSLACPISAGILDDRGNFPASSFAALTSLYSLQGTSAFRDITSGSSGIYSAGIGYDLCTGLGAPTGLYLNYAFEISAASLVTGVVVSGVPDNVILKDDHLFEVRSSPMGSNAVAAIGVTFGGHVSGSVAQGAKVSVTGLCTGEKTQVLALNLKTLDYDVVGSLAFNYRLSTQSVALSNPVNYINSSGVIKLQVVGVDNGTASQLKLGIDQATLQVEGPIL